MSNELATPQTAERILDLYFPEWLKERILNNTKYRGLLDEKMSFKSDVVNTLMIWKETPEGQDWWEDVYNRIQEKDIKKQGIDFEDLRRKIEGKESSTEEKLSTPLKTKPSGEFLNYHELDYIDRIKIISDVVRRCQTAALQLSRDQGDFGNFKTNLRTLSIQSIEVIDELYDSLPGKEP